MADVTYDDQPGEPQTYWFEFPASYRDQISTSGNPWLVALAPLAVTLGEPLRIQSAVDAELFGNVEELMHVWASWYPHLKPVPVYPDEVSEIEPGSTRCTAAFFSGGVDSFFTVLRHDDPAHLQVRRPVDDLLTVWGFDVPLDRPEEFERMSVSLAAAAADLRKNFVPVATNLRRTRWRQASWGPLAHGCGLGSIALALERRYEAVLIGSSAGYRRMYPWGSHPVTDRLLSTSTTRVVHDGARFDRFEKTEYIASSEVVRHPLRVCWKHGAAGNCSRCSKCLRTMAALAVLDSLSSFSSFEDDFDVATFRRWWLPTDAERAHCRMIVAEAQSRGQIDIARHLQVALRRSRRRDLLLAPVKRFDRTRFASVGEKIQELLAAGTLGWP